MNQPDRDDLIRPPDFKLKWTISQSADNTAEVEIFNEDHTIANLIRKALIKDEQVIFAGYIIKHPLDTSVTVKIQTTNKEYPPQRAFEQAVRSVQSLSSSMSRAFESALGKFSREGAVANQ